MTMRLRDQAADQLNDRYIIVAVDSIGIRSGRAILVTRPDFAGKWHGRYFEGRDWHTVDAWRIEGVAGKTGKLYPYHSELSGPDGAHFTLFVDNDATAADVQAAKADLHNDRDVTGFTVYRVALVGAQSN